MDKSKKAYIRALEKYNNGYIEKAIQLCEESISLDIKNAAALNLKGLLFYLKGDLNTCQRLWKMNYQVNRDGVSERYLNDSKNDNERQRLYQEAISLIKALKIKNALENLEQCSRSDYNYINVNNYIALCYINKGEYNKALSHIEKVLAVDVNNIMAKESLKMLKKLGISIPKKSYKRLTYIIIGSIFVIALSFMVFYFNKHGVFSNLYKGMIAKTAVYKDKDSTKTKNEKPSTDKTQKDSIAKEKVTAQSDPVKPKVEIKPIPAEIIKKDVQNKNYDNVYNEYIEWKDKDISADDKEVIASAYDLLVKEGSEYFYNKGYTDVNLGNYSDAKESLIKAYNIGSQSYLYSHIMFMLGSSYDLSGDKNNALKYYLQYTETFAGGNYEETVLYNIMMIYKDSDKEKAKIYGKKIIEKYPNSIYNNSITYGVVNN